MKVILCILINAFLLFGYTLSELVELAFKESGYVKNSDLSLEESIVKRNFLRSTLLPQVNITSRAAHFGKSYDPYSLERDAVDISDQYTARSREIFRIPDPQDLIITDITGDYANRSFAPKENAVELGLSIEQPLFQQGKVLTSMRMNKMESSMLICQWQDEHMRLKSIVSKYYYNYLLMKQKQEIISSFKSFSEQKHEILVHSFKAGECLTIDTLESYLSVSHYDEQFLEAEQELFLAQLALTRLTGISDSDTFTVSGELTPLVYNMEFDTALIRIVEQNKVITKLRGETELAELGIEMAKREYLPEVSVGVNFNRLSHFNDHDYFSLEPERQIYLGMTYNLFSSGKRYFNVRQRQINKEMTQNRLDESIRELQIKLKEIWGVRSVRKKKLDRSKSTITAAEEGYRIAKELFENGVIPITRLHEIEETFLQAKLNYVKHIYDYNCSVIELRLLTADYLYN